MSDAIQPLTITAVAHAVMRDVDHMYYVFEYEVGYGWRHVTPERGYVHSTSAYAQLGRITNREHQRAIAQLGR